MLSKAPNGISFEPNRCCQCGVCLSVCPHGALTACIDDKLLIYRIDWQREKCSLCGRCVKTCPASVTSTWSVQQNPPEIPATYLAWITDERLRYCSSSGGACRGLIQAALDCGLADYAYTLLKTDAFPWAQGRWMRSIEDLSAIANSLYLPLMFGKNLYPLPAGNRLLVAGLPCQLAAFTRSLGGSRSLSSNRSLSSSKVKGDLFTIAIFCKQQKTFGFARFFASLAGYEFPSCPPITFRGNGWPGQVSIGSSPGSYSEPWEQIAGLIFGKKLWRLPACALCADPFASGADLVLADPWGISGQSIDAGKTLVFAMSMRGRSFLESQKGQEAGKRQEGGKKQMAWNEIPGKVAFDSIDWPGMVRKARLKKLYAGQATGAGTGTGDDAGTGTSGMERLFFFLAEKQKRVYESLLDCFKPPVWLQKVIGKLPDLERLVR
ncbi:MAG: Coenzyme F420 hydrogenase/dehydrogenase, beta subunit C-terminal domain [bacterium]